MHTHSLSRRRLLAWASPSLLKAVSPKLAFAQSYPTKPIKLVHGFGAGAAIGVVARLVGQKLEKTLGQSVIVDARPGATATIANQLVISSPQDGYTLLIAPLAAVITASHLYPVKNNPLKDLVPISKAATFDKVLVTESSVNPRNVFELIALAKSRARALTFASPECGTGFHIARETPAQLAGVNLLHMPYKGGGTAELTDVLAGRIDMEFESLATVKPQIDAGKLRLLAVTGASRSPVLSHVSTVAEKFPGYQLYG